MKKRNLDRHENAAINLGKLAEEERQAYLEKLKKRKKINTLVEDNYKNERIINKS